MATTVKETVKVDELSKFGFKMGQEYINYSKQLSETDKANVVPGVSFEAELYVADSGKRYLNKILAQASRSGVAKPVKSPVSEVTKAVKSEEKAIVKAVADAPMTKAEWSAKDRSQLIGGLSHDAAELVAAMLPMQPAESISSVLDIYKEVLLGLLKIRDEVR